MLPAAKKIRRQVHATVLPLLTSSTMSLYLLSFLPRTQPLYSHSDSPSLPFPFSSRLPPSHASSLCFSLSLHPPPYFVPHPKGPDLPFLSPHAIFCRRQCPASVGGNPKSHPSSTKLSVPMPSEDGLTLFWRGRCQCKMSVPGSAKGVMEFFNPDSRGKQRGTA
jgi:hypothetical protein